MVRVRDPARLFSGQPPLLDGRYKRVEAFHPSKPGGRQRTSNEDDDEDDDDDDDEEQDNDRGADGINKRTNPSSQGQDEEGGSSSSSDEWEYEDLPPQLVLMDLSVPTSSSSSANANTTLASTEQSRKILSSSSRAAWSVASLHTARPLLKVGNINFLGEWQELVGTGLVLEDTRDATRRFPFQRHPQPLRPEVGGSMTQQVVRFRQAVNVEAREREREQRVGRTKAMIQAELRAAEQAAAANSAEVAGATRQVRFADQEMESEEGGGPVNATAATGAQGGGESHVDVDDTADTTTDPAQQGATATRGTGRGRGRPRGRPAKTIAQRVQSAIEKSLRVTQDPGEDNDQRTPAASAAPAGASASAGPSGSATAPIAATDNTNTAARAPSRKVIKMLKREAEYREKRQKEREQQAREKPAGHGLQDDDIDPDQESQDDLFALGEMCPDAGVQKMEQDIRARKRELRRRKAGLRPGTNTSTEDARQAVAQDEAAEGDYGDENEDWEDEEDDEPRTPKRKPGRPKGSKNKPKPADRLPIDDDARQQSAGTAAGDEAPAGVEGMSSAQGGEGDGADAGQTGQEGEPRSEDMDTS
ncbi:hypothetical protein BDZ90DRAFT_233787 [Jaminaea rosea]|uniref:Transcription factor TFIIIC triple barrel domain-containing protein n=1 Tax=Jaminaea rosea TaxID=1569628 RepID=A0A316UKL5_9BASI|nr:hypothetical protein BDZ90DRAFT_233787 [Jaminaea rosea]PWN25779.1 hypothetical protein BDZ90DRAFT_233787 [Jaminaea rosea]